MASQPAPACVGVRTPRAPRTPRPARRPVLRAVAPDVTTVRAQRAQAGVAATGSPAARAAADIVRAGGNAVDAAVAAAFVLAVCEPASAGLGGRATLLVASPTEGVRAVDGRTSAPAVMTARSLGGSDRSGGRLRCAVPSLPAVLGRAHARWGALGWHEVLQPAIELAVEGYLLTVLGARLLAFAAPGLRRDPAASAVFLPGGRVPHVGERLRQPALARTLSRLAAAGPDDFYTGGIAREVVADMAAHGGLLDADDLARAATASLVAAPAVTRDARTVTSAPGGGTTLLMALQAVRDLVDVVADDDAHRAVLCAVAARAARQVRDGDLAGGEGPPDEPVSRLREEVRSATLRGLRRVGLPVPAQRSGGPSAAAAGGSTRREPGGDATHLSLIGGDGLSVALTTSMQSVFGSRVVAGGLGVVWNDDLVACSRRPGADRLGPSCRPRTADAPVIVLDHDARPVLSLGASGQRASVAALVHVLTAVVDRGTPVQTAVRAPRARATSDGLWVEHPLVPQLPRGVGVVRERGAHAYALGAVHAVQRHRDGSVSAVTDPRREGAALAVADPTRP